MIDSKLPVSLARVIHDLLNPLAAVHGNLSYLEGALSGDLRDAASEALGEARRLERLLREIELFARIVGKRAEIASAPVALAAAARAAAGEMAAEAKLRGIHVAIEGDVEARADHALCVRAIGNLLAVAVRYAKPGTTVRVAIDRDGERARLAVVDAGPVPPDEERRALLEGGEMGDRTRVRPAAALPLAVARAEVEAMGGALAIEPREDGVASVIRI